MTERRFSGLCGCIISAALAWSAAAAADTGAEFTEFEAELGGSLLAWVQQSEAQPAALDEQIFTEISPLLDSPQGVRLPEEAAPPD